MPNEGGDNITIRTMKDDLTATAGNKSLPAKLPNPVASAASFTGPKPTGLPLPPVIPEPFRDAPNLARRNRRRMFLWIGGSVGLLALVGAGAWAFITFFSAPSTTFESPLPVTGPQASVPIPVTASLAIHYGSLTPDARGQLLKLWQNSDKTLLQGNPKTLLGSNTVTQFMYVVLSGDSRPYLLIPKPEVDQQLISQLSQEQVVEYNGLYILHALNASPYLQALSQTQSVNPITEQLDDTIDPRPIRIYLSEGALNQIRKGLAGEPFTGGTLKELLLAANPMDQGQGLAFEGLGSGGQSPVPEPSPVAVDQSLIASLPADAGFIHLGVNLAADLKTWEHTLDKMILDQPAVAAHVAQLNRPYAYYHRLGLDGSKDFGVVINAGAATLGDVILEDTLKAALPLIASRRPVSDLAFNDGAYQGIPLRFLNITGTTQALDYAIQAGQFKIATSKEGMFALLEKPTSVSLWNTFIQQWGAVPAAPLLQFGHLTYVPLLDLLPVAKSALPTGFAQEPTPNGPLTSGIVLFNL